MKTIIFAALAATASAAGASPAPAPAPQADTRVFTDADGFQAEETAGGYEPAASPLSGPVTADTKIVFVPQALTPSEAYPAPAAKTYPPCKAGRTDECRQPR